MNRNYFAKIALGISSLATVAGLCGCNREKHKVYADEVLTVNVARPEIDSIVLHKSYPAYLTAKHSVEIVGRVNGSVVGKHFDDGQWVEAGAPLFTIESTTYRQTLNEAKARLQTAQATYEYNSKQYEAMKRALESDAVSKMDVIQAESAVQESLAQIASAKAAIETASMMLGYCTVRSPIAGNVAAPTVQVGDYVSGEASPMKLTTVYDNRAVSVHLSVEDNEFLEMTETKRGKAVDYDHIPVVFGDSILNKYTAHLDYKAPSVNKETGTLNLRLGIDNGNNELRNGMYATVLLPYDVNPRAVIIKDASIATDQLGKYVYVVNDSNRVVYTPIKVGELYHDSLRVVVDGLGANDRYVTEALMKVRDGMKVNPVEKK